MGKSHDEPTSSDTPPSSSAAAFMLGTLADTTWRMFVPGIGGVLLGVWADRTWGTTPWLMIVGIILGFTIAGLLVWRQLTTEPTNPKDTKR